MSPGGFGVEAFGVVSGRHQQRSGSVGPDAEEGHQVGSGGEEKGLDLLVELGELSIERLHPMGQRGERCFGGRGHRIG
jgi:hypothetical protein